MRLVQALSRPEARQRIARAAVAEAESAVGERSGLAGMAAQVGLNTINALRPGLLVRHMVELLPALASSLSPHWETGLGMGSGADHLVANAQAVTSDLLAVTDRYVNNASDAKAIAVYQRLRPHAPARIAEQMPRIAAFVERHEADAEPLD